MFFMLVTECVFHAEISALKAALPMNKDSKLGTERTSHALIATLLPSTHVAPVASLIMHALIAPSKSERTENGEVVATAPRAAQTAPPAMTTAARAHRVNGVNSADRGRRRNDVRRESMSGA